MKRKMFLLTGLIALFTPCTHASYSTTTVETTLELNEGDNLQLQIKKNEDEINNSGIPIPRTLIPEVTLQNNILHFITSCNGCTFRLVQSNNICYEVDIMGNTLSIPSTFTGTYELQIVNGDIIFYTEIIL